MDDLQTQEQSVEQAAPAETPTTPPVVEEDVPEIAVRDGELVVTEQADTYTAKEIEEIGIDKLDPKRLPKDLVPFYKSLQADYTRKTQALAEQRKKLSVPEETPPPVQQFQPQPEQAPVSEQSYMEWFGGAAKDVACRMLGIQPDKFDEFNPQHIVGLNLATTRLNEEIQRQAQQRQALETRKQQYSEMLEELRSSEPHFAEIDAWGRTYVESLPYTEYSRVMKTFASGDMAAIKTELLKIRKAWYDKQTVTQTPPVLESAGSDQTPPRKRVPLDRLGSMSEDEQAAWIAQHIYD
mgnify:CR=1 FL=1